MTTPNIRATIPRVLVLLSVGAAILALSACGSTAIDRGRLERSLPQTFANLYVQQAKILGHQGVTVKSLQARASCDKGGPKVADHGPGADWTCLMSWKDPSVPLTDGTGKFELNVHSNDCYTAGGPSKLVGLVAITNTRGDDVRNPVFEFDSCFDPKGPDSLLPPPANQSALSLPSGAVIPDATGHIAPELRCSRGAAGGCAGLLTARVGARTLGTLRYALAPAGKNTFPFTLSRAERQAGTALILSAAPLVGTVTRRSASLTVSSVAAHR